MQEKLTVIGCGSTGMATAAWLTKRGFSVTLCDTESQSEDFEIIKKQNGIFLEGALYEETPFLPERLTVDFNEAVSGAAVLLICVSARRQPEVLELAAPYIKEGQTLLLIPGNMGSVYFKRKLRELNKGKTVVAEMCGNIWACRRTAPGKVLVALPPSAKHIAAYPSGDTQAALASLAGIIEVEASINIIETTLNSPNVVSHVAGTILNAVQIERKKEEFALFEDGLSESFITCTNKLEAERNEVLGRMKLRVLGEPCEKLHRLLMTDPVPAGLEYFKSLKGPSGMDHRYVAEDAACGLALLASLARLFGSRAEFAESCLIAAGVINRTDYLCTGRTVEELGIQDLLPACRAVS